MDKAELKEVIKKYKEKFREFAPYYNALKGGIDAYESAQEKAGVRISSGMVERIKEIRKGFDKFEESNDKVEYLKDNI